MVRDRSSEFRRQANNQTSFSDVLENGSVSDPTQDSFFNDASEIRKLMDNLVNDIECLKTRQSNILAQAIVEDNQKLELDRYIATINQGITNLKPRIIKLKSNLERIERQAGVNQNSTDMRMRRHQMESLLKKLYDLIEQFTASQNEYKQRVTRRIKRQLDLAGEEATEAEIDSMLESKTTQIFYRGVTSAAARLALEDATSRHGEILKLEQSINELHEMYKDVAFLVHTQGEVVSNIDDNVEAANVDVERGMQNLRVAVRHKKSALKKKVYCYILIAVVIAIIIAIIIVLVVTLKR